MNNINLISIKGLALRYSYFITIYGLLLFASCKKDFLERTPSDFISGEEVFTNFESAEQFLNNAYQNIDDLDYPLLSGGGFFTLGSAIDETFNMLKNTNNGEYLALENYSAGTFPLMYQWSNYYQSIRIINVFLQNLDKIPEDIGTGSVSIGRKKKLEGEAYGLRAFYYFALCRMFGGVPLIDRPISVGESQDKVELHRSSIDSVVSFIKKDIAKAEELLPMVADGSEWGRFSGIAAKALLAKVNLYYASPLWNPANDKHRWEEAAETATDAINAALSNGFYLSKGEIDGEGAYERIFLELKNSEVLWVHNANAATANRRDHNFTGNGYGGWWGEGPTQDMVDVYEMKNGEIPVLGYNADGTQIVNPASGYDPQNPYINRGGRFYQSITYQGASWQNRQVNFAPGGLDNFTGRPRANYFVRKYVSEAHSLKPNKGNTARRFPIFRLSDLYLMYAEAQNEAVGPDVSVYSAIDTIRVRGGVPVLPAGLTQDQMRARVRHERRIEFAFENSRFWDVRRWMIADEVYNKSLHYVLVDENGEYSYPVWYTINFDPEKAYFFPIPQKEVDKDPNLEQNPGW